MDTEKVGGFVVGIVVGGVLFFVIICRIMAPTDTKKTEESSVEAPASCTDKEKEQREGTPVRTDEEKVAAQLVVGGRTIICSAVSDNEVTLTWAGEDGTMAVRVNLNKDGGLIPAKHSE